jgi:pimeloyl-ACP methyl ester carboxylesterase
MQGTGQALLPIAPAVSRSIVGRALTYSAIVSRPGRISPAQARGDMAAFLKAKDALNEVLTGLTPFASELPAGLPVTLAWGTRDRLLPPRQILVAKARLPDARLVPLPGCGHVPMTDDPALVAQVLLRGSRDCEAAQP